MPLRNPSSAFDILNNSSLKVTNSFAHIRQAQMVVSTVEKGWNSKLKNLRIQTIIGSEKNTDNNAMLKRIKSNLARSTLVYKCQY